MLLEQRDSRLAEYHPGIIRVSCLNLVQTVGVC
jgi:hypothetical protein